MQTTAAPSVPVTGTPAFWQAQHEAVALFSALREHLDDAERALPVLRQIGAHGRARQLLAAHGHDADQLLRSCEAYLYQPAIIRARARDHRWFQRKIPETVGGSRPTLYETQREIIRPGP